MYDDADRARIQLRCGNEETSKKERESALELREISVVVRVAPGGSFHELEKLPQGLALGGLHGRELDAHPETGIGAGNHASQNQPLTPVLAPGDLKSDLYFAPRI